MKKLIVKILFGIFNLVYSVLVRIKPGRMFIESVMKNSFDEIIQVKHNGFVLKFVAPNTLNRFRANTFSTKEPETLEWVDGLPVGSVLWDIGANVGLYSCYAAITRNCKVYSFEPSVFNLELLSRNLYINEISESVVILPIPLTDGLSINKLNMTSMEWGGALSTFGKEYGHDGKALKKQFEYQLLGMSIDEVVQILKIPAPDYIKMDVDGIEQLILAGAKKTLKNVKGLIVEINEDFEEQRLNSEKLLSAAGLKFKEKRHAAMFDNTIFNNTYNQIWVR